MGYSFTYFGVHVIIMRISQTNKKLLKNKKTVSKSRDTQTRLQHAKKKLIKHAIRKRSPVHKRVVLHPISIFFMLCSGIFMVAWTFHIYADSYTITAEVAAAPITGPATITAPIDGARFHTVPITISGTCPDKAYVELYRNNEFSGVTSCDSSSTIWQIHTDLSPGSNDLYTRVFNVTNSEGPQSAHITIWYDQPVSTTVSSSTPVNNVSNVLPMQSVNTTPTFRITSDFKYQTYTAGKPIGWNIGFVGGVSPYALTIIWGDGYESTMVRVDKSTFSIYHTYQKAIGDHKVIIEAIDNSGAKAFLQTIAIGGKPGITTTSCITDNANNCTGTGSVSFLSRLTGWIWVAWPVYITVLLMAFSFWLGERQEYLVLIKTKRRTHGRQV